MSFGQPVKGDSPWALRGLIVLLVLMVVFGIINGRSGPIESSSFQDMKTATDEAMMAITPDLPR